MVFRRIISAVAVVWAFAPSLYLAQDRIPSAVYEQTDAALQQGKLADAEQVLRSALQAHPREVRALGLLAVILDAQKRYDEAESVYEQAVSLSPGLVPLSNNLGNHYLARGELDRARDTYLRVVALEPDYPNANLQLAKVSVAKKQGAAALKYLNRLPSDEQVGPAARILRAQALHLSGQHAAAEPVLQELERIATSDPQVAFSVGMVYVEWQRFDAAENAFSLALRSAPTDFDILYNMGLAAIRAGHLERAQEVLQIALRQRPDDVDCIYGLARVYADRAQEEQAMLQLVRAERLAPGRADVLLLLGRVTEKLGFFGDTATAYDKYLKLRPGDGVVRRERGFALARTAKLNEGLRDLRWYVERHPTDARGLYELAVAETVRERERAVAHLDRAIELDANLLEARQIRAFLNYYRGRPRESVSDSKFILVHDPKNYLALDMLGESYLQLGQVQEAVDCLRRATELAPSDSKILMHYSRSLLKANRKEEAAAIVSRVRQLGRRHPHPGHSTGARDLGVCGRGHTGIGLSAERGAAPPPGAFRSNGGSGHRPIPCQPVPALAGGRDYQTVDLSSGGSVGADRDLCCGISSGPHKVVRYSRNRIRSQRRLALESGLFRRVRSVVSQLRGLNGRDL